ncbi:MAG: DUF547 domain-containing protein [Calditrichaeota bacterium]|nr:DUF547 domain-containing protein [Calditrichota bacterium]MCB9472379.1 DUF547 domain-containing protein [Candidatus Delongbacteria bacterium]
MMRHTTVHRLLILLVIGLLAGSAVAKQALESAAGAWGRQLAQVVSDGRVSYRTLAREPGPLDAWLDQVALLDPDSLAAWPRPRQLALLLNLYNGTTLRLVRDNLPVGSIKEIGGWFRSPWSLPVVRLAGETFSLDELEHRRIRPVYNDPRIHVALVCAARGCPPLREELYTASGLEEQLDDQARRFLQRSPTKNRLEGGTLWLSPIFKWYAEDFGADEAALKAWLEPWLPGACQARIRWTDYDWSLNAR